MYAGDPTAAHNTPFPQVSRALEGSPRANAYGEHFGTQLQTASDDTGQHTLLWVGTPAKESAFGRLQAGSLGLWSDILDETLSNPGPILTIEGNESFQRVGSHFWGSEPLFVRTQSE